MLSVQSISGIQVTFQATCATPDDANTLNGLLQAGLMLEKYQASQQKNDTLSQMLDSAHIVPNNNQLTVSVALSNEQVVALIQTKTFALQN
jgi:hypothetical protein